MPLSRIDGTFYYTDVGQTPDNYNYVDMIISKYHFLQLCWHDN